MNFNEPEENIIVKKILFDSESQDLPYNGRSSP
jgi:hypothetical protein